MKILSLFDGISIAQQALKELGIEVEYYASEIDKYAISVAKHNFPNMTHLGSVVGLKVDFQPDLLIGGSPCQDLSIAKKDRKGLDGSRSGLFYEYVRILNETKPKYFILENVNSMPKEAKETITKELFGIEPVMINAALVSAQNRKRLFWVGKLVGDTYVKVDIPQPEDKGILLRDILEERVDDKFYVKEKSNTIRTSGRGSGIDDKHNWDTIRIGDIGSNAQAHRVYSPEGKSVTLSALGGGQGAKTGLYHIPHGYIKEKITEEEKYPTLHSQSPASNHLIVKGVASRTYPRTKIEGVERSKQIEIRNDEKSNAMTSVSGDSMVMEDSIIRKLTPVECERLMTLPDNYTSKGITEKGVVDISNSQRYKMCGNGFVCEVIKHILKNLYD